MIDLFPHPTGILGIGWGAEQKRWSSPQPGHRAHSPSSHHQLTGPAGRGFHCPRPRRHTAGYERTSPEPPARARTHTHTHTHTCPAHPRPCDPGRTPPPAHDHDTTQHMLLICEKQARTYHAQRNSANLVVLVVPCFPVDAGVIFLAIMQAGHSESSYNRCRLRK